MNARPHLRAVAAALIAAVAAAGCSVSSDSSPRDIDPGVVEGIGNDQAGAAAGGSGRIFLVAPASDGLLSVARDIDDDPAAAVAALLAGPNNTEFLDDYRSALPIELRVNSVTRRPGGVVTVDLSEEIQLLSGDVLILALAQIVYSLSEVTGVDAVLITVDGLASQWPAGNNELQSDPLTVYDYPGMEPSSQPAYPAIPSGR